MRDFVMLFVVLSACGSSSTQDAGPTGGGTAVLTECQLTVTPPERGSSAAVISGKGTIRCPMFATLNLQVCLDSRAPDAGWVVAKCESASKSDIKGLDGVANGSCVSTNDYRVRVNGRWNVTDLTELESAPLLKPSCQ